MTSEKVNFIVEAKALQLEKKEVMTMKSRLKSKYVSAAKAVAIIESGTCIYVTGNAGEPKELSDALVVRALSGKLQNIEVVQLLSPRDIFVNPELKGRIHYVTPFISSAVRKAINSGDGDFVPCFLQDVPSMLKARYKPDVALVHVSPPDEHGMCSLGVEAGLDYDPVKNARIVVAEVNDRMPRLHGHTSIHMDEIDFAVKVSYELIEIIQAKEKSEIVFGIARNVASLVEDGSVLQTGIGLIPDAVLEFLNDRHDLGIHTELFSDGVMHLIKAGVITGMRKKFYRGKVLSGLVLGSRELYDFVNDNPMFEFRPQWYVNNPFNIARNDNMVSINSAIEIDLTGQVCASSIMPDMPFFSGVGGQVDFIYGASRAKNGKAIIALPSTATLRNGTTISRIVVSLKPGSMVTTSNNHVCYVATEYGIVDLRWKSIRERARLLISIAHPNFREQLEREAYDVYKI